MEKSILMKVHSTGGVSVMAICDEEVLGRTFRNNETEFRVARNFYGGDPTEPDVILRTIPQVQSVNAVGEKSIELLARAGFLDENSVMDVGGTLHAQIYSVL
jgi:hypothetical protein